MEPDAVSCTTLKIFESRKEMAFQLAHGIIERLKRAISIKGRASVAVSGGSTPAALYEVLSQADIQWSKVIIVLVDERWVRPGENGSNETFVSNTLLQENAAQAQFIGLWSDTPFPRDAALVATHKIEDALLLPFDVVLLGMGEDGHTASWFPYCVGLGEALENEAIVTHVRAIESNVTGAHLDRLTLGLGPIECADFVVLMIAGDAKRTAFELACDDGPVEDMPVRAILAARPDLFAAWAP